MSQDKVSRTRHTIGQRGAALSVHEKNVALAALSVAWFAENDEQVRESLEYIRVHQGRIHRLRRKLRESRGFMKQVMSRRRAREGKAPRTPAQWISEGVRKGWRARRKFWFR